MTEHAALAPSSAEIWANCAPGLRLIRDYGVLRLSSGGEDSTAEGTAAHWYVSQCLSNSVPAEGDVDPAGTPITEEMIYHGDKLLDLVRPFLADKGRYDVLVETRVFSSTRIHEQVWGTPDIVVVDKVARKLRVFDYKYGFRIVEEYLNEQCTVYLISVMATFGLKFDEWSASVTIVQPRAWHPRGVARTWEVPSGYLEERAAILKERAAAALDQLNRPSPHMTQAQAGPWCRDCANHACSTFRASAYQSVAVASLLHEGAVDSSVAHLVLRQWQEAAKTLKHAIAGLEGDLLARVNRGDRVPGVSRSNKNARERWTAPAELVIAVGAACGKNLAAPAVVTPAQARKMGVDESVISSMSEKPLGEVVIQLTDESDVRKAFQ